MGTQTEAVFTELLAELAATTAPIGRPAVGARRRAEPPRSAQVAADHPPGGHRHAGVGGHGAPPLHRDRRALQEVGRGQRRRLLSLRPGRPGTDVPRAGQARRRRLPLLVRLRRARRRPLLRAHRREPQRPSGTPRSRRGDRHGPLARRPRRRHPVDQARPGRRRRHHARLPGRPGPRRQGGLGDLRRRPADDLPGGRRRTGPAFSRRADLGAGPGGHGAPGHGRAEPGGSPLPGPDHDLRVGGRGRRLRHGQLPPRGRPGARAAGPLARHASSGTCACGTPSSTPTTTTTSASPSTGRRCGTKRTVHGRSGSPRATPGIRTGSPRPDTTRAGSGSAGSCPSARPKPSTPRWCRARSRHERAGPATTDRARRPGPTPLLRGGPEHPRPDVRGRCRHVARTGRADGCGGGRDRAGRLRARRLRPPPPCPLSLVARRGQAQRRRRAGAGRAGDRPVAQPPSARGPGGSTSRDPGRAGREAHRHLRAAPHRHHASAQPDVLGPRAPVPALLGEHGAGPGRAGTPGGGRPGPEVGTNGAWPCPFSTWPCPSSSACTR